MSCMAMILKLLVECLLALSQPKFAVEDRKRVQRYLGVVKSHLVSHAGEDIDVSACERELVGLLGGDDVRK